MHVSSLAGQRSRPCLGLTVWRLHRVCFKLNCSSYFKFERDGGWDN